MHRFKYPLCGLRKAVGARIGSSEFMRPLSGYKRQQNGVGKMVNTRIKEGDIVEIGVAAFEGEIGRVVGFSEDGEEVTCELIEAVMPISITIRIDQVRAPNNPQGEQICSSCNTQTDHLHHSRRHKLDLCVVCRTWVRMSLRRTRNVPRWIRPDSNMTSQELAGLREEFRETFQTNHYHRRMHAEVNPQFAMGFTYSGPLDERSWGLALSILSTSHSIELQGYSIPNLPDSVVDEELSRLEEAGVVRLPRQPLMRKQVAHILRGDYGLGMQRRMITMVFLWLVSDDEFIARVPDPWATSFNFLRDVVNELGDRASFVDGNIRVVGSSGNTYTIAPKRPKPYYQVSRLVDGQRTGICIDPIGANRVVFGDVLVTLVLSLYDDQISARRINTLSQHVFGQPFGRPRRNANVDHLWRRALGNIPLRFQHLDEEDEEGDQTLPMAWQRLLDRFQTSLADWTLEEEGE